MFPSIQGKFFFIQYDQWDWFSVFKPLYDRRTVYFVCLDVVSSYFVCFLFSFISLCPPSSQISNPHRNWARDCQSYRFRISESEQNPNIRSKGKSQKYYAG